LAPKSTVPKSARGRTPELLDGASAIHSADDRAAEETDVLVLNDFPLVSSASVTVNSLVLLL
jgi:hypothetical protein